MTRTAPTSPNPRPRLRLAGDGVLPCVTMMPTGNTTLQPGDPRWVFALRVAVSAGAASGNSWADHPTRDRLRRRGMQLGLAPHHADAIATIVLEAGAGHDNPVAALHEPGVLAQLAAVPRPGTPRECRHHVGDGIAIALGAVVLLTAVALFVMHTG
ncbi:MAG: hypothetical protein DHS20C14_06200 [Phycisphaeraceae bacterium]|nr:MAG: hypothetical protein DHS20C14_06200 [Phycisphaeraceae bacterium]